MPVGLIYMRYDDFVLDQELYVQGSSGDTLSAR